MFLDIKMAEYRQFNVVQSNSLTWSSINLFADMPKHPLVSMQEEKPAGKDEGPETPIVPQPILGF